MTKTSLKIRKVYFQVKVDNLERSRDFYKDIFNFNVAFFIGVEVGWAEMELPNNARLGLNLKGPEEARTPNWGILTFEVEDLQASWKYFKEKGLKPTEITDIPQMVSYFNIKDSEDNTVQIVGDPRIKE